MSDVLNERREDCKKRHLELDEMWSWFWGNGNPGAKDRLPEIEDLIEGKKESAAMIKLNEHLDFHKENKKFMWGVLIPVYLMALGMLLQFIGII